MKVQNHTITNNNNNNNNNNNDNNNNDDNNNNNNNNINEKRFIFTYLIIVGDVGPIMTNTIEFAQSDVWKK
jgi:hypothetical protein